MSNFRLHYKLLFAACLFLAFQACKKSSDLNNNTVIETPYALYFSDSSGSLHNTNDGNMFKYNTFFSDGVASRAICVSGNNLLWIKHSGFYSSNSGHDFNVTYANYINPFSFGQSTIWHDSAEHRVYLTSLPNPSFTVTNGVIYSDQDGLPNTWKSDGDTLWQTISSLSSPVFITSFTQLANDSMIAYDAISNRIFSRKNKNAPWMEKTNTTKVGNLPVSFGTHYQISHFNNTVIALDSSGINGAWYSNDLGTTWNQYSGLPSGPLLCGNAPFEQLFLVGTANNGIYMLNTTTNSFSSVNTGLHVNPTVFSIVGKQQLYVNGITYQFIYIGTDKGLYRSQDNGNSWINVWPNAPVVDVY